MAELILRKRYRKDWSRTCVGPLSDMSSAGLWPDVANHLARSFTSQADTPNKVLLIQFRSDIKPEADGPYDQIPKSNIFYEKYLQPEDLR